MVRTEQPWVYEGLDGWSESARGTCSFAQLPVNVVKDDLGTGA